MRESRAVEPVWKDDGRLVEIVSELMRKDLFLIYAALIIAMQRSTEVCWKHSVWRKFWAQAIYRSGQTESRSDGDEDLSSTAAGRRCCTYVIWLSSVFFRNSRSSAALSVNDSLVCKKDMQ